MVLMAEAVIESAGFSGGVSPEREDSALANTRQSPLTRLISKNFTGDELYIPRNLRHV